MKKIVTVIGARPQFIKAAAVSRAVAAAGGLEEVIVHTGQHFDANMSQVFFDQMSIPRPDYHLNINGLTHGAMTGAMLAGIEEVLLKERPDHVMVYGDTNSTLAGALAAAKLGMPLAHVEAGLRSFNMAMPEEVNRILTDRVSSLLFCPTQVAKDNLLREGFDHFGVQMIITGDVMYDAMLYFRKSARPPDHVILPDDFVVATVHRAENTDNIVRLGELIVAINELAVTMPVVFPMHPRTAGVLQAPGLPALSKQVMVIRPVGYLEMLYLLLRCKMVVTDSGGMQKEAYFFGKPCITIRDETEWTELVDAGYNRICGSDKKKSWLPLNLFRQPGWSLQKVFMALEMPPTLLLSRY
jgi:UDP-GlcNAc3NAcA epimerase